MLNGNERLTAIGVLLMTRAWPYKPHHTLQTLAAKMALAKNSSTRLIIGAVLSSSHQLRDHCQRCKFDG